VRLDVQAKAAGAPPAARVRRLLDRAAGMTKVAPDAELSILFCGDGRMRRLNRRYRRKDESTDVLAFPAEGPGGALLGDIVVSIPYAARQARRRSEPVAREVDRLLVHGFLHLLGYDHEVDDGEMDALEADMRVRLGIAERAARRAPGSA
jgi:probable rRNA maturation factor